MGSHARQTRIHPGLAVLFFAVAGVPSISLCMKYSDKGASSSDAGGIESVRLSLRVGPDDSRLAEGTLFELLSHDATDLDFVHHSTPPDKYDDKYDYDFETALAGGGVAIGDYDGDGLPDIYLTRPYGGNRLYRNRGSLRFEDVTERAGGVGNDEAWNTGATFVDIDGDGDLDLYLCIADYETQSSNRLYLNQGDGTFEEEPGAFGLDFSGVSVMMAFADYDLDGDMDGYLLTNRTAKPVIVYPEEFVLRKGRRELPKHRLEVGDFLHLPDGRDMMVVAGQYDHLYRNVGEVGSPEFVDVSTRAQIRGNDLGLSATWWDFNGDGFPDLYVANDFYGPDRLYRNNGDGTFADVAEAALPHTPWFSMGSDFADLNNDGRLDFLASDMSGTNHYNQKMSMGDMGNSSWFLTLAEPRQYMRNAVYLNTGTDRFMEIGYLTGLASSDWTWSVKFADFDSDGWVDVFVTNGMTRDWGNTDLDQKVEKLGGKFSPAGRRFWLEQPTLRQANLAFKNRGDLQFESVGRPWGLDQVGVSYGAALADLDRDGDMDMIVNSLEERVSLYRNRLQGGYSILVRLKGRLSNRFGIGATLRAEVGGTVQVRHLSLSRGFMSADEPLAHFGLGELDKVDRLTVEWPSGHKQSIENLDGDHFYTVNEPAGPLAARTPSVAGSTMFVRSKRLDGVRHRERPYDDFQEQPLLPNQLSQLGPGLAWGDVDGDGDEDLYVGGASGQAGTLAIRDGSGTFSLHGFMKVDQASEDMAALFFDADSDDDLDLYVVSGGVVSGQDDAHLKDRLYLNNGEGKFKKAATGTLPDNRDSGSTVVAGDFDRDGDLDLFVGGRMVPGKYPLSPISRLLQNDGGAFVEVREERAPGLPESGMVTGALWTDANGDGWLDLIVTYEWGPVRFFRNNEGQLEDRTHDAGLAARLGWWNGVAGGDVDRDGDIDYVVSNFGLNTKYHASLDKPLLLYYGDFDGSGKPHLIEAEFEEDIVYPVRGKSCSTEAMPFLAEKFATFQDFAVSPLEDIYQPKRLNEAHRFEVNTLELGMLINDGNANFSFEPLPRLAQVAPGFGTVLAEVDGDGCTDLYIAQNFFSPQPETGRMDGGMSLLLMGNCDGTFEPVWPNQSGLLVPGDAKALTATDLNGDGWVDFVVAVNDGHLQAFENRGRQDMRMFSVRLLGKTGNPTAVGARVTLQLGDGSTSTAEVYAGGGYLSQSTPGAGLRFGLGRSAQIERINVVWPDGKRSSHQAHRSSTQTIGQP